MTELELAACDLAGGGARVFPCGPDKAPLTEHGFHDATSDAEQVVTRWHELWAREGTMIGRALDPGEVVVDFDPRHGSAETWAALRREGLTLPETLKARTGGGGVHLYYAYNADAVELRGGANAIGRGIDARLGGKHYVIVPPSPGYSWELVTAPADAPEWLLEKLRVRERETATPDALPAGAKFFPWDTGTPYGIAALERQAGRLLAAQEGGRNDALNRAAFAVAQLVAGGELDESRSRAMLEDVAERLDLDPRETERTLDSGWDAGLAQPWSAPEREDTPRTLQEAPGSTFTDQTAARTSGAPGTPQRLWVNWEVDEPPPAFWLHPILPKNAYVLVYGETEAAKSIVFAALSAQASCLGVKVSFYSLENPPHVDRDRFRRLRPCRDYLRYSNEPLDLSRPDQISALVEDERSWGADLVVFDTYAHAYQSRSEDGNARAIEFARVVRHLMHEVGCTVIVLDHTGYMNPTEPRDASAKRQQVDVAIQMEKGGNWIGGQPARFRMTNRKAARFANPFELSGSIVDGDARLLNLEWDVASARTVRWEAGE